jgi:hypothetical protein
MIRFVAESGATTEQTLVARQGEKNRKVVVEFHTKAPPATQPPPAIPSASSSEEPDSKATRPTPVLVYVLGGVGVAALGSFAFFAASGKQKENEMFDECAPGCPQEDADSMRTRYLIADVSLGVSLLSLGTATVLYFTRPTVMEKTARARTHVGLTRLAPERGEVVLGVDGTF